MQFPLCRHVHTNGIQCGSPALTHSTFCFFHKRLFDRHQSFRHADATRGYLIPGQHLELAPLEDRASVQLALSVVVNALATGQLEVRRATAILYGLQLASQNSARTSSNGRSTPPNPAHMVRLLDITPEGLDLALPGALTPDFDEED